MFGFPASDTQPPKTEHKLLSGSEIWTWFNKLEVKTPFQKVIEREPASHARLLSLGPKRFKNRQVIADALEQGDWQHPIFNDPDFPYYALDALKQDLITPTQFATVTDLFWYKKLAAEMKSEIKILPILNDDGELSPIGRDIINVLYKQESAAVPRPQYYSYYPWEAKSTVDFVQKVKKLPKSERFVFCLPPLSDAYDHGSSTLLMEPRRQAFKLQSCLAVFSLSLFFTSLQILFRKNAGPPTPVLGILSPKDIEESYRNRCPYYNIMLPHSKVMPMVHQFPNNPFVSIVHDKGHIEGIAEIDCEVHQFAGDFLLELIALLGIKWTSERWGFSNISAIPPREIPAPDWGVAWKKFIFSWASLESMFDISNDEEKPSEAPENFEGPEDPEDVENSARYYDLITYFFLTYSESEIFKKYKFQQRFVEKIFCELYPQHKNLLKTLIGSELKPTWTPLGFVRHKLLMGLSPAEQKLGVAQVEKLVSGLRSSGVPIIFAKNKPLAAQRGLKKNKVFLKIGDTFFDLGEQFLLTKIAQALKSWQSLSALTTPSL